MRLPQADLGFYEAERKAKGEPGEGGARLAEGFGNVICV